MSLARIYTTKKVRKDWTCGKCGKAIRKGVDGRISYAVGFRGYEQTRCTDAACYPTRSERESSALSSVYAAIDGADLSTAGSLDDLQSIRDEVVEAIREVAEEYESNEMFEINEDLQDRANTLNDAADELENWEPEDSDEPDDEIDCEDCDGTGEIADEEAEEFQACDTCGQTGRVDNSDEKSDWLEAARTSLSDAINDAELP